MFGQGTEALIHNTKPLIKTDDNKNMNKIKAEERKRANLDEQVKQSNQRAEEISELLEEVKRKQRYLKKKQQESKPLFTLDMAKRIKEAFISTKEHAPRIESLENQLEIKLVEIGVKLGNKADIVEMDSEVEALHQKINGMAVKGSPKKASRKYSSLKINPGDILSGLDTAENEGAVRKYLERCIEEIDKKMLRMNSRVDNLEDNYTQQTSMFKKAIEKTENTKQKESILNLESQLRDLNMKMSQNIKNEASSPLINYTLTPSEPPSPNKVVISNNSSKLETEKSLRDFNRKLKELRIDTFQKFDDVDNDIDKFKKSCSKILERQDHSIISILTRISSLELRVDGLEVDGMKSRPSDSSNLQSKNKANQQHLIESLQIAEKLTGDFKSMRNEVFKKLYEIQEKDLKLKAN